MQADVISDSLEVFVLFQLLRRVDLHELNLDAPRLVVEECDPSFGMGVRAVKLTCLANSKIRPLSLSVGQSRIDVIHLIAYVVESLGTPLVDPLRKPSIRFH